MRLVQLHHARLGRRTALVDHESLVLLDKAYPSLYDLVWEAITAGTRIRELIGHHLEADRLSYDQVYSGQDDWDILPSFDHAHDPMHCLVSGTGLTHRKSAEDRASMHSKSAEGNKLSDSMKMYLWGEEGGKPDSGRPGVQPEWFYKGNGNVLRGHRATLEIPSYALDGGEEPEIAGVYVIDPEGIPVRVGMTMANEFSDHVMEQQNYLYLAPSKLRQCAIGPELILGAEFSHVEGSVQISRNGELLWKGPVRTGEAHITHSLDNLEYHHFKYPQHRVPGQVHIHFFGACGLSFSDGIRLQDGDEISISMKGYGRPLKNTVMQIDGQPPAPIIRTLL